MESTGVDRKWLVAYCKSRNEKLASERLNNSGIEVYCPLQETMRQWSDRKKKVKMPVFPSYIFVFVNEEERLKVLQDSGVSRFVFWLGKPAIIRDSEMIALKNFLDENKNNEFELFESGKAVTIESGPFKDQDGVIIDIINGKAIIELKKLGIRLVTNNPLVLSKK